jgi:hypothetical protein
MEDNNVIKFPDLKGLGRLPSAKHIKNADFLEFEKRDDLVPIDINESMNVTVPRYAIDQVVESLRLLDPDTLEERRKVTSQRLSDFIEYSKLAVLNHGSDSFHRMLEDNISVIVENEGLKQIN